MEINRYTSNQNMRISEMGKNGVTKKAKQHQSPSFDTLLLHEKSVHEKTTVSHTEPMQTIQNGLTVDKGTAGHTTVHITQSAFDKIVNATTYTDRQPDWEEIGCDENKRWVVIHGQRFECPRSQAEKDRMKSLQEDFITLLTKHHKDHQTEKNEHDRGNIASLRANEKVVQMLHGIFGTTSFDSLVATITGKPNTYTYA